MMYDVETMTWNERGATDFVYAGLKLMQDKMNAVYSPEDSTEDELVFKRDNGDVLSYPDLETAVKDAFWFPKEAKDWVEFRYEHGNIDYDKYEELMYPIREYYREDGPDPDDWHDQQVQDAMMGL